MSVGLGSFSRNSMLAKSFAELDFGKMASNTLGVFWDI